MPRMSIWLAATAFVALPAIADVNVGISLSTTGPAASLGIAQKNTVPLLPASVAGEKINYIVLDDATDPSVATRNARKLVAEDKVDVLIGSSSTPSCAAIAEVAFETSTPQIAICPVDLAPDRNRWVFRSPQPFALMASALVGHMKANKVATLGFIGYSDAYGESWLKDIRAAADAAGIKVTAVERYNRTDTSVTGQVLKLVAANPDAVLIVGSGTPAALPHVALAERNYKGQIYQTHGAANREFLRVGGKALEGGVLPVGPVNVASQLPDSHPSKKAGLDYIKRYEDKYGAGSFSSFGAHLVDSFALVERAIPVALRKAKPGTAEFRAALRDAVESEKEIVGTHGVFNMSPTDHYGLDARGRVLVKIQNGDWKLLP